MFIINGKTLYLRRYKRRNFKRCCENCVYYDENKYYTCIIHYIVPNPKKSTRCKDWTNIVHNPNKSKRCNDMTKTIQLEFDF